MSAALIWGVVFGMGALNIIMRYAPMELLSRMRIPAPVERWLSFVPVSVMAALVAGEVLRPGGHFLDPTNDPHLIAAIPTALMYWRTRSFLGATVVGLASFVAVRALMGA